MSADATLGAWTRPRGGRLGRGATLGVLVATWLVYLGALHLLEPRLDSAEGLSPGMTVAFVALPLALLAVDGTAAWLRLHDAGYSVRALPFVLAGWLSGVVTLGVTSLLTSAVLVSLPPDGSNAWGPPPRRRT